LNILHQFICFVESFRSISGDVIKHVPLGALHCVLNDDMLDMNEKLLNRFSKVPVAVALCPSWFIVI